MLNLIVNGDYYTGMRSQIANQIAVLIRSGRIEAGDTLPSEAALADAYKITRSVVREAYQILKDKKLIRSNRRRETMVADEPRTHRFKEYMKVQLPGDLKEKIHVVAQHENISPDKFVERELTGKVNELFDNFLKQYKAAIKA